MDDNTVDVSVRARDTAGGDAQHKQQTEEAATDAAASQESVRTDSVRTDASSAATLVDEKAALQTRREEWMGRIKEVAHAHNQTNWLLGDALNDGEGLFGTDERSDHYHVAERRPPPSTQSPEPEPCSPSGRNAPESMRP